MTLVFEAGSSISKQSMEQNLQLKTSVACIIRAIIAEATALGTSRALGLHHGHLATSHIN